MKAKPLRQIEKGYEPCEVAEATHVEINRPGPFPTLILPIQLRGSRKGTGNWSWNGDTEKPTLKPSVDTKNGDPKTMPKKHFIHCHSWITDGKIKFLGDCTHSLKGQTLDLLDVD